MGKYVLTCCSTADLAKEHFDAIGVKYICFHYTLNGTEYPDDLGASIPFEQFYKTLETGASVHTSQVNVEELVEFFTGFAMEGLDVLHISFSSGLSGEYNSACTAADLVMEQYPERKIYVVDSLGASSGYGLFVDTLAERKMAGAELEALRDWALENRLKLHHWFLSTDLSFYVRGGRIS